MLHVLSCFRRQPEASGTPFFSAFGDELHSLAGHAFSREFSNPGEFEGPRAGSVNMGTPQFRGLMPRRSFSHESNVQEPPGSPESKVLSWLLMRSLLGVGSGGLKSTS